MGIMGIDRGNRSISGKERIQEEEMWCTNYRRAFRDLEEVMGWRS
jgi:hypothetical protein